MSVTRFSFVLALALGLVACDGGPSPDPDAGQPDAGPPDAGPPDAGPPLACSETMRLDAVLDDTVSVMLDTTMTETRPRDLGLFCGNVEGELRWAPQEVIELHIPGSGEVEVQLDTVFDETDHAFNTVLQVRETCERVPEGFFPPTCFDDVSQAELRSKGAFIANGGDTVFVFVTGFSEPPAVQETVDAGRVRLDVTVRASTPPTLTEGTLFLANDDTLISATGHDPAADVRGVALNFFVGGRMLDIYGDGEATENGSVFLVPFDPAPTTADYTGNAVVPGSQVNLTAYLRGVGATHARFRVYDSAYALSEPVMVPIEEATLVGEGEACGETGVACRALMSCVSGVCAATGPIAAACNNAIELAVPADGTAVERGGTTGAGLGNFAPSTECAPDPQGPLGAETIYRVDVPAGVTADLIATTDLPGSGSTDTILYVRSSCPDESAEAELACNDDRPSGDVQSYVEVSDLTEGSYFIFVERWGGLASGSIPHALSVRLRPVLEAGASCDPTGVMNRCAGAACGDDGLCP